MTNKTFSLTNLPYLVAKSSSFGLEMVGLYSFVRSTINENYLSAALSTVLIGVGRKFSRLSEVLRTEPHNNTPLEHKLRGTSHE